MVNCNKQIQIPIVVQMKNKICNMFKTRTERKECKRGFTKGFMKSCHNRNKTKKRKHHKSSSV